MGRLYNLYMKHPTSQSYQRHLFHPINHQINPIGFCICLLYNPTIHSDPTIYSFISFQFTHSLPLIQGLWILMPSVPVLRNDPLHSSYARPPPNPNPTHAGHALLLNSRTEKTTPKDRPSDERIRRDERQRSHCRTHIY
jgi:hypothetical protein